MVFDYWKAREQLSECVGDLDVPFPCWLGGDGIDQGPSYCRPCAEQKVMAGLAQYVDGGWLQESDGCCHCESCGRLLDYSLTDYGITVEKEHFLEHGFQVSEKPQSPDTAFHLLKLLEAAPTDHDIQTMVTDYLTLN